MRLDLGTAKNTKEVIHQIRTRQRSEKLQRWIQYAMLLEAFLLPLWPLGATIALLVGIACWALRLKLDRSFHFRALPFDVPVILFLIFSAISILSSPDRGFSFYNYYNLAGVYFFTYLLIGQNVCSLEQVKKLLMVLFFAATLSVLYGYQQYLFGIDTASMRWVDGEAFPELKKRVFSTWENPNIFAGFLDMVCCALFGFFIKAKRKKQKAILLIFLLLFAVCLTMTYARGALFTLAFIIFVYGILRDRKILFTALLVAGLLLLFDSTLYERMVSVFTKMDTSTEMRLAFWESTLAMIEDHPFFGIGWGAYWMVYPEYDFYLQGDAVKIVHAHNLYLNYIAEIGIIGACAFFWYFFGTMVLAFRLTQEKKVWGAFRWKKYLGVFRELVEEAQVYPQKGGENLKIQRTKKQEERAELSKKKKRRFSQSYWNEFCTWEDRRFCKAFGIGMGLTFLSVAINGITDNLLFNIPTSMLLWFLAALIAVVAKLIENKEDEVIS